MSEATVPQPDADNDWDTIDEAVRGQLGQFLTSGTNLFNGSDLMGGLIRSRCSRPCCVPACLLCRAPTRSPVPCPAPQAK